MLTVRVILFDAVGTLIRPEPSVAEVYYRFGTRFGSCLSIAEIQQRFSSAFRRQQEFDRQRQWRTDENREYQRWQAIVREVFAELDDTYPLFQAIWEHFARPDAWACFPEVADTLARLGAHGYMLGIASNFDGRLRSICVGLPGLRPCSCLFISSQLGWLKPARQFFDKVCQLLSVMPHDVLYIGDDYQTDCLAARQAGWQAVWLCRGSSDDDHWHAFAQGIIPHQTNPSHKEILTPQQPGCPVIFRLDHLVPLLQDSPGIVSE